MANSDKDILITPNKGTASLPEVSFVGQVNSPIKLRVLDDNTLSFEGSAGQLFSINNNLTSGTIFAVSDVSGVPSLSVNANGLVSIAPFNGNVALGRSSASYKLDITGDTRISGNLALNGETPSATYPLNVGGNLRVTGSLYHANYKTVSCYIRGTGLNNSDNPVVIVDGVNFMDSYGRGLMLIIINKSNLTKVSRTNYDTYGTVADSDNLATALNAMTNQQIGILASFDAIESSITANLRTAARRLGLYKLAMVDGTNGIRKPYAAIFTTSLSGSNHAVEVLQTNASNGPFATIYTRIFTDGSAQGAGFSGQDLTNALESGDPTQVDPAVIVSGAGSVGIANTSPNSSYKLDVGGSINVSSGNNYLVAGVPLLPVGTDTTRGSYLVSDGSNGAFWAYPGQTNASAPLTGWRYRSLLTHGYIAGGYKGSNPWRSINKTWHTTDVTFYCGEQLDRAASYLEGTFSDYNGYVHGTVNAFSGGSNHTSSYGLHTGVMRQFGDGSYSPHTYGYDGDDPKNVMGYNTWGGWDMPVSRDYGGCAVAAIQQAGYETGGGNSTCGKLHFPTEIMYATTGAPAAGGMTSGCGGESRGWFNIANTRCYIAFSNDTWTNTNFIPDCDAWSKALGTKYGHQYWGTSNNVTTPIRKVRDSDGANLSDFNKIRAVGEENYEMGQDWGYMLGNYDGQQNNHSVKFTYSNDVQTTMGASTRPKGHYGQSSGACSSAAATVTATRPF